MSDHKHDAETWTGEWDSGLPLNDDAPTGLALTRGHHPDNCACVDHERERAQRVDAERAEKRRIKALKGARPCDSTPSV